MFFLRQKEQKNSSYLKHRNYIPLIYLQIRIKDVIVSRHIFIYSYIYTEKREVTVLLTISLNGNVFKNIKLHTFIYVFSENI